MKDLIGILVALGGGAGIALAVRELVGVIGLLRRGVSAKEGKRKIDLVQQRDEAFDQRDEALDERDAAVRDRDRLREYATTLRLLLIETGYARQHALPSLPDLEYLVPRAKPRHPPKE